MFFGRRLLFILILALNYKRDGFNKVDPSANIIATNIGTVITVLHLAYYLHCKPFEEPDFYRLEVFNEINLLIIMYFLPIFSGFVNDS